SGQRYDFNAPPLKPKEEFTAITTRLLEREGYYREYELSEEFLRELQTVVELAQTHDIELKLFISPTHATLMESLWMKGLSPQYEDWKRAVVAIAPVWDFSGYNSITTEPLSKRMENYVDTSHYSSAVGDLILSQILDGDSSSELPDDFGVWLTPNTLESHFDQIAMERAQWLQTSAQELEFVYQPSY
ncbi:MAG: hypothetical protein F6K09_40225, partial [Merismopedia sp. SIO2A8]|nr:hypothetical protein [Merismopedia sp. SIO2A8]